MYWLLPRFRPGALTTHERAGVRFSTAQDHTLPHGATARLLMVWMHIEAQRTGCAELPLGRLLEAFAGELDLDAAERAEQTERLCACTVSQEDWTCPIATHATAAGGPALRLGAPLHEALRDHRLEVSLPCLRELHGFPELLDHYLRKCYTVELYRKVRLACREGMSERAAARHFGISRESVRKMLRFSVAPGYRLPAPLRKCSSMAGVKMPSSSMASSSNLL